MRATHCHFFTIIPDTDNLINSRDVVKHCRESNKVWTSFEMEVLISQSNRSISEKHSTIYDKVWAAVRDYWERGEAFEINCRLAGNWLDSCNPDCNPCKNSISYVFGYNNIFES